jgi:hypothetical protein
MTTDDIQVKTRFCKSKPFAGLDALGMWYGNVVPDEIRRWERNASTARMGKAKEKIALCCNQGWTLRRVITDGVLLEVYDWKTDLPLPGTLLPVALLGKNITLLDPSEVPPALKDRGGYACEFEICGQRMRGWILEGRVLCAAWSDAGRPYHFETQAGRNPNGRVIRRIDGATTGSERKPWEAKPEIAKFVNRILELIGELNATEDSHLMIMPSWAAESVAGSWTVVVDGRRFALLLAIEAHRSKAGIFRACLYAQQLKGKRCTNTANASVHTGNADVAGVFRIRPALDPPQRRALRQRLASDPRHRASPRKNWNSGRWMIPCL